MQEFNLDRKFSSLLKVCLIVFLAFFILGAALLFMPAEGNSNPRGTLMISVLCMGLFGILAALTWNMLKKLPYTNIVADDDGLWYKHESKEHGLLRWEDISRIRERAARQCLDIFDRSGRRRIRVEYQLDRFETLRRLLNDKAHLSNDAARPGEFSKGAVYHLFYGACVLGFALLGLYVGRNGSPVLGFGGMSLMVAAIIYEYMKTAHRLEITPRGLTVHYPLRKKFISYVDIIDIDMADTFHKGARYPEVRVFSKKATKPYAFQRMGADANVLYVALNKAMKS